MMRGLLQVAGWLLTPGLLRRRQQQEVLLFLLLQ
jgi:hypothetical protein